MEKILDKFLRYVAVETTSNDASDTQPSSQCQFDLLQMLTDELNAMGVKATLDEWGYVMATIPSNIGKEVPAVGFIAHVDTAPDASGKDVKPQIIENYNGEDVVLNAELGIKIPVSDFPEIKQYKGQTLITTDGTTLLGADDKAGVAEIMSAVEYIVEHPEFKHGEIKIGFTPDEEIGRGVDKFDVEKFGAKYAYTMDGGQIGELEYENFNAAGAKIAIQGRNVHPGYAKNKMINAIEVACELNSLIPAVERPQFTEGYEGFYHCIGLNGTVENATISYIIRDHDFEKFEKKKSWMYDVVGMLNNKYGQGTLTLTLKDQYYNMRKMVEPHPQVIDIALAAMRDADVEPIVRPIRGGTDGARLSFMGLPCPNIFAGGMNFHGKFEYCSLNSMEKSVKVIINIAKRWAE